MKLLLASQRNTFSFFTPKSFVKIAVSVPKWSEWWGSNSRPRDPKSRALPTELHPDFVRLSLRLSHYHQPVTHHLMLHYPPAVFSGLYHSLWGVALLSHQPGATWQLVEPAGIEPASEIPTWTRHSYAIDDFSALHYSGRLRYRQIYPRAYNGLHTSTTLSLFNRSTRKNCKCWINLLPQTFTYIQLVRRFGKSSTNQAAILSAMKAAKAGWIIMTVSVLSFHFCLSL